MQHTTFSAEELEDFSRLLQRIFGEYRDPARGAFDAVYLFSHSPDNEDSVLRRAVELQAQPGMRELILDGGEGRSGWLGFEHTCARLRELGWSESVPIQALKIEGQLNTRSEAIALERYASHLTGDIAIVAPPFHLARAFITTISVWKNGPAVYAVAGSVLPWGESAVHSQGILRDTRVNLLDAELERLDRYRVVEFGSLASFKEVLAYLDKRG